MQTDAFDGVFDDPIRRVREKLRDGEVIAMVRANALGSAIARKLGMDGEFGSFPARPDLRMQ